MGAKYWSKIYHEILHDRKMGKLPDNVWRRCIELFLMAGELDEDGHLPCLDDIAWNLRVDEDQLEQELQHLINANILERLEGGTYFVTNFAKRQAPSTAAERKRQQRARERSSRLNHGDDTGNVTGKSQNVTPDKKRREKITEVEEKNASAATVFENGSSDPELQDIYRMYESNVNGLSPIVSQDIADIWRDTKTPSTENIYLWFEYAFKEACTREAKNWKYIKSIIKSIEKTGSLVAHKANGNGKHKQVEEVAANGSKTLSAAETYQVYCETRTSQEALRYARLLDPSFEPPRVGAIA